MDVVLPYRIKNEQKFFDCAFKMGFDEMSVHKFLYMFHQSDVDIFPRMGDDRISALIYGWGLCEDYKLSLSDDEWELPEEIEVILKILVPWSLDIWFSKEWDRCKPMLRYGLIHCLNRARSLLLRSPDMMQLNWEFLLLYNQTPWQVSYLKSLTVKKEKTLETGGQTIEMEELPPTTEDLQYIKLEQFSLIVLRLVKLFDQGSIDMVKTLCMRVLSAWNKVYHTELETAGSRLPYVPPEDKRCLLLICHIYLMAVYEADDVKGYVIDNMINNIRFYSQCFQTNNSSYAMNNLSYTPARFIALTSVHLRLQKRELFDFFIWNSSESSPVNLFGVVAQAYKSYLLGNLLMELNNMNDEYFASNTALYKRLMNSYVNEREKSEMFMIGEMQKLDAQRYAHNIQNLHYISDFKSKICKGNRMSNIGNYENADDVIDSNKDDECKLKKIEETGDEEGEEIEEVSVEEKENELSVDPIFQNIPNNEEILYYVYDVLSKKTYRGWQFAKIVLLFKIISHELNMLETWRYHPGLTTKFMLNLETKLSQHYIDLAKIFKDYPFMEQEFWLTAFYLSPSQQSYEAVKRLGIRNNRRRNEEPTRWTATSRDSIEAKYGLLSSTIDVKEIVVLTNADDQNADYIPLTDALHSLHLPDSVIKDILTVIFLPRNRSFSWAVEWNDLRRRCKMLMSNTSEKKRFVELTMAEANDRLKFLNIDYAKYKNRPQLDYGSIEQGYENLTGDLDGHSDDSEEEEEDFEDDEDVYESQKGNTRGTKKQEEVEVVEDDNSQEDDPYLIGKRRTRARTAAAMASLLCTTEITTRRKRRQLEEELLKEENEKKLMDENEEKSNDSKTAETLVAPLTPSVVDDTTSEPTPEIEKRNIKECIRERPLFSNSTEGFQPLIDMWNIEKSELLAIDTNCVSLLESSKILNRFAKLKRINKHINPTSANDEEQIDEVEMVIKQEKTVPKLEKVRVKIEKVTKIPSPSVEGIEEKNAVKEPEEMNVEKKQTPEIKVETHQDVISTNREDEFEDDHNNENDKKFPQTSEQSEEHIQMETDQELQPMMSDIEAVDLEASSQLSGVSQTIVETVTENVTTSEVSVPVIVSDPQKEPLREMSPLRVSVNQENISGITIDAEMKDTSDIKTTSSEISSMESNENESIAEQEHITESSAMTTISPIASTESELAVEKTITTDDTFQIDHLLDDKEKPSTDQDSLNNSVESDSIVTLEKASVHQNKDAIPSLNTDGDKVVAQVTSTEIDLPGTSLSNSGEIKLTMEATPLSDTNEDNTDSEEKKSIVDDLPNSPIEAVEIIATEDVCLASESILDMSSIDNSSQDSDKRKIAVDEAPIDNTAANKPAIDEPTSDINEGGLFVLDSKESETINEDIMAITLPNLDGNVNATEHATSDKNSETFTCLSSEEAKSVISETLSSECGAIIETLYSKDELLLNEHDDETSKKDDVAVEMLCSKDDETGHKDKLTNNTAAIDELLLSSEELQSVTDEISVNKIKSDEEASENNFTNSQESLADESAENQAVEKTQEITIAIDISPAELDERDSDLDATPTNNLENDTSLELEKPQSPDTNSIPVDIPYIVSDENKSLTSKSPEQTTDIDITLMDPEDFKPVVEETTVDLPSVDKEEIQSAVDTTFSNKNSEDMPSLYSDESKSALDYNLSQTDAVDMPTLDSEESKDGYLAENSIDSPIPQEIIDENNRIKKICLTRPVRVRIRKLRPSDLANLRQPKVRVKRIRDVETFLDEALPKRARLLHRFYVDVDESSDSLMSNSSNSSMYRPAGRKSKSVARRTTTLPQNRTSDSDCDSNNSFHNVRKRRMSTPNAYSNHSNNSAKSSSRASTVASGNLVVIPRSASGLKLRISHADQKPTVTRPKVEPVIVIDEIIQVSSSSYDESNTMDSIVEVPEEEPDPLYEEAVIELRKTR